MDSAAAALLGMGLAAAGFAGAGVGIGYIFGKMIEAVARQPEAEARVGKYMWIGFALVEAIALYGLVIAFVTPLPLYSGEFTCRSLNLIFFLL
jgi:F-type H+-transporting ATPase subunit c